MLLVFLLVLTPLTVVWAWDPTISAILLILTLLLLLFTGNTVIFLLRLVAADRRGRRRPLSEFRPQDRRPDGGGGCRCARSGRRDGGRDAPGRARPLSQPQPARPGTGVPCQPVASSSS